MNLLWLRPKIYKILYLVVFFLLLFTPTSGFSIKISAEGVEPLEGRNIATVRDIALSKALSTAVENTAKGINPNLDNESLEKLRSESLLRYIKAYRVLYEISIEEEYKITIEADVDSERLKNRLEGFVGTVSKPLGRPSISIIVLQTPESDPIIKTLSLSDVKREISTVLIGSGYKVVEPLGDVRLETYASIKTTESKVGANMYYALGSVFIKAKDKDGKVITEVSDSSYLNGTELSQLSLEVLKRVGANATKKLKSEFDKRWDIGQGSKSRTIEVSFIGLRSYNQYEQLDTILSKSILGIDGITKRIFRDGRISFLVLSRINPEELAKTIQKLTPLGLSLRLDNASLDRIEFSVVAEAE